MYELSYSPLIINSNEAKASERKLNVSDLSDVHQLKKANVSESEEDIYQKCPLATQISARSEVDQTIPATGEIWSN